MDNNNYKKCATCGEIKPFTDFYKNGKGTIGSYCKPCKKAYQRDVYDPLKEKAKEARQIASGLRKKYSRRMRLKYPEKYMAREAVGKAIKHGEMKRLPCEKCGDPKTEAHHDDYSKPLQVRWLCRKHHHEHHRMT